MTAFQACPGIAEVTIQAAIGDGDIAVNKFHVSNGGSGGWTLGDLTTLVNTFDTWLTTTFSGSTFVQDMSNTATVNLITARDLTTATGQEYSKTVSHTGGDTTTPLPVGLSKAITLRSGLAGRSQRGRVFLFGLTVSSQDTDVNAMKVSYLNFYATAFGGLVTAVAGAHTGWVLVVLSRYNNLTRRSTGVGTAIVSAGYSHVYFDFQRRRAPAHARHH